MSLKEIANELVAGCREGREMENLGKLYSNDAVSVEAADQGMGREAKGLDAIRGKHEWWDNSMDVIESHISDPFPHGDDRFAVHFKIKGREKGKDDVWDMEEIGVYHVKNDKIVREEFFYAGMD